MAIGENGSVPALASSQLERGYGAAPGKQSFLAGGQNTTADGDFEATSGLMGSHSAHAPAAAASDPMGSTIVHDTSFPLPVVDGTPSRSGTLRKKSISRKTSLRRSASRKSIGAGSIKTVGFTDQEDYNSALFTPIPTSGSPTEILANRFQGDYRVQHVQISPG